MEESTTHPGIAYDIDSWYMETIRGVAEAGYWLQKQVGPDSEIFERMYVPFRAFFMHTKFFKELDKCDCKNEIEKWMSETEINATRISKGIELFETYQAAVIEAAIINTRRQ